MTKGNVTIPHYRLSKAYRQLGIAISHRTMYDVFHRAADEVRPLYSQRELFQYGVPQGAEVHFPIMKATF